VVGDLCQRRAFGRDHACREGTAPSRLLEGADNPRRTTARTQGNNRVAAADLEVTDGFGARVGVVLGGGPRRRREESLARDARDHLPRRGGKRRLALRGIDPGEVAGGPRAEIDQPAAALQTLDDGVDRGGDPIAGRTDGSGNGCVLVRH
jgi:hypothetical protein